MGNGGKAIQGVLAAILLLLSGTADATEACRDDSVELRGDWGSARFSIELADEEDERAQGLMNRESMPASSGMLFVYPAPREVRFWMRNTLIPLDMLFADRKGIVRYIQHEAEPLSERLVYGGNNIQYVLEINGGLARRLGIAKGSEMRHPAIDPTQAAWPCPQ